MKKITHLLLFFAAIGALTFDLLTLNCSAQGWYVVGTSTGTNGTVYALKEFNTKLISGGDFTTAGGVSAIRIAAWNGSAWTALGSGTNGPVRTLAEFVSADDLYVGGSFTTAGGVTNNRIARWDGASWLSVGTGASSTVYSLTEHGTTVNMYAGGTFTSANGNTAINYVGKISSTAVWSALTGGDPNGPTYAVASYGGNLYAGGEFDYDGFTFEYTEWIKKWTGITWSSVGTGPDWTVRAMYVFNGDLYVAGEFNYVNSTQATPGVAKWNGTTWTRCGTAALTGTIYALGEHNGNLIAGRYFYIHKWRLS